MINHHSIRYKLLRRTSAPVPGNREKKEERAETERKPEHVQGAMSIGYSRVTVILLKAVQELSAKVTALENA